MEETRGRLAALQNTLETDPAARRGVLRQLLLTPIIVAPVLDGEDHCIGWDYLGAGAMDRVLAGRLPWSPAGPITGELTAWTTALAEPTSLPLPVGAIDSLVDGITHSIAQPLCSGERPLLCTPADFASNCAPNLWEGRG